eukprot:Platyproteum_vivax@DN1852_c0_g1_i1.p1
MIQCIIFVAALLNVVPTSFSYSMKSTSQVVLGHGNIMGMENIQVKQAAEHARMLALENLAYVVSHAKEYAEDASCDYSCIKQYAKTLQLVNKSIEDLNGVVQPWPAVNKEVQTASFLQMGTSPEAAAGELAQSSSSGIMSKASEYAGRAKSVKRKVDNVRGGWVDQAAGIYQLFDPTSCVVKMIFVGYLGEGEDDYAYMPPCLGTGFQCGASWLLIIVSVLLAYSGI